MAKFKSEQPVSSSMDDRTIKRLAEALDEMANAEASAGGDGWMRACAVLREAADRLRAGTL